MTKKMTKKEYKIGSKMRKSASFGKIAFVGKIYCLIIESWYWSYFANMLRWAINLIIKM